MHFDQQLFFGLYLLYSEEERYAPRASLRAPSGARVHLFIYSSVITQVFNNKVLMISYSTDVCSAFIPAGFLKLQAFGHRLIIVFLIFVNTFWGDLKTVFLL